MMIMIITLATVLIRMIVIVIIMNITMFIMFTITCRPRFGWLGRTASCPSSTL